MLQKMGPHNWIEFADYGVYFAWQFSKYNVRRATIFEVETFMCTHQVKAVEGATSHDPSRSQLVSHHKASLYSGLLVGEILSLKLKHLWPRIRSQDVRRVPFGRLPRSSQVPMVHFHKASISWEILSLRRRHLWARIRFQDLRRVPFKWLPGS